MKTNRTYLPAAMGGALLASTVFTALLPTAGLHFMADDFVHLEQVYAGSNLMADHFSAWTARLPVWSVVTCALFASRVLEHSVMPYALFFAAHAMGIGLITAYCLAHSGGAEVRRAAGTWVMAATAVVCFYPNAYEIYYWPSCLPYALGALLLGVGCWLRSPWARGIASCLAALTYETSVLPALILGCLPAAASVGPWRWRPLLRPTVYWAGAMACAVLVRWAFALQVGAFHHEVRLSLLGVFTRALGAMAGLLRMRNFRMHTGLAGSLACCGLLVAGIGHRWRRARPAAALLVGVAGATALSWVLEYGAMRAIYGAQVLLCAALVVAVYRLRSLGPRGATLAGLLLCMLGVGFAGQHRELRGVKRAHAAILGAREEQWRAKIAACVGPCTLAYADLGAGLDGDWVLPRAFWPAYLAGLRNKYAAGSGVTFAPGGGSPPGGR